SALDPSWPDGHLGAASALLRLHRLDEARERAARAAEAAGDANAPSRAAAHTLLAKIALARRDEDAARAEAAFAPQPAPALPLPAFGDARILYDQGRYAEAPPLFEQAIASIARAHARPMADLHFYTGDTLVRLDRLETAEPHLLAEIRAFPQSTRAR